jgi:hypothetical protein
MEEKEKLKAGPRWWPNTRTDWPNDRPSQDKFEFGLNLNSHIIHLQKLNAVYVENIFIIIMRNNTTLNGIKIIIDTKVLPYFNAQINSFCR